jgi:hypothetical protein
MFRKGLLRLSRETQQEVTGGRETPPPIDERHADVWRTIERLIASNEIDGYAPAAYTCGKGVTFRYPINDGLGRDQYPTLIPERDLY